MTKLFFFGHKELPISFPSHFPLSLSLLSLSLFSSILHSSFILVFELSTVLLLVEFNYLRTSRLK